MRGQFLEVAHRCTAATQAWVSLLQLGDAWHGLFGGSAHDAADPVQLVRLVLPGEQAPLPQQQLGKHAAHTPHVDLWPVVRGPQQQLRRPACTYGLIRRGMSAL